MLPVAYQLPAAAILVAGGFLSCFFGYRLFKVVLALFGFILGGLAASSVFGESTTTAMVIAAVLGGLGGAFLLLASYFVGVALVGAGIGALAANLVWTQVQGDPHPFVVILFSIAGALLSRPGCSATSSSSPPPLAAHGRCIVGGSALMGNATALKAAAAGDVWVGVSDESRARQGMGAVGLLRGGRRRHAGADALDRR